jgi:hypothetical protein
MTFYRGENESVMNIEEINPHLTAKIVSNYVRHQTVRPEQFLISSLPCTRRSVNLVGCLSPRKFVLPLCRCDDPFTATM